MRIFTARDAAKKFGELLDASDGGPVTIVKSGRPRAVIVCARLFEQYEKAFKKANEERVADLVMTSLDLLKDGKLGGGERTLALARRLRLHEERPGDARAIDKLLESRDA